MQRARNLYGYATGTANDPKGNEEEENAAGNRKQPARNPVGGSHSWEEESAARARLQRAGNLDGYVTGTANDTKEDEEEENAAGNSKQPTRNPVGGSQGWGNENAPTSAPSTLGIPRGYAGRQIKQATTLPEEGNAPMAGKTSQELHRVLMGGNLMLHNTDGGGNGMGGGKGKMSEPTSGQNQCAGRRSTAW